MNNLQGGNQLAPIPISTEGNPNISEPMCNLHMRVPMAARRNAKLAAVASGIPFRQFVAKLLLDATPIASEATNKPADSTHATPANEKKGDNDAL